MLFKRKSVDPPPDAPAPASLSPASMEADRAIDTVASVLKRYGEYAFETRDRTAPEIRQDCDQWADKILRGGDGEGNGGAPRRDFGGLRRFFDDARKAESAYVNESLASLRGAVQTFARCVQTSVVDDRSADDSVGVELAVLVDALSSNDSARIRSCSQSLAEVVASSMRARRDCHQAQLNALAKQLRGVKTELLAARERATVDALTRLYNRAAFDEHIARIADLGMLLGTPPSLMMIDVDSFKKLNDTHGHPAGDEVLRKIAECLVRNFLRKEDFIARYGGEEFSVVLMDASRDDAKNLAERLCKSVRSTPIEHRGKSLQVTISVGLSSLVPGEAPVAWIERADRALYAAKGAGRDRVVVADLPATFA